LLAANDGKMPLASELARQKPVDAQIDAPEATSELMDACSAAMKKLTDQGVTRDEAIRVIAKRIEG
jgi:Fe2+ transport system protein FeoA